MSYQENGKRIRELLREIRIDNGYAIEKRAIEALLNFVGSEKCPSWLLEFIPTQCTADDEDGGTDGVVVTDKCDIKIQIATSDIGLKRAKQEHPEVPAFKVERLSLTDEEIVEIFLPRIKRIRNKKARRHRP